MITTANMTTVKDYWINVSQYYNYGRPWENKQDCLNAAINAVYGGYKTIYRIHVRLK